MRSNPTRSARVHALLLTNMTLGMALLAVAVYFIITGEYSNLAERQATEGLLNQLALGALLYSAACWYADLFLLAGGNRQNAKA